MLRAYSSLLLWVTIAASRCATPAGAQTPLVPPSASTESLVVLRNGEVLHGAVTATGDRLLLTLPGRELSLRRSEIDVVARSLEDAYDQKRAKTMPTSVEGRLDLAEWCLRQGLFGAAAHEIAAVQTVKPRHPRLNQLDERLQHALAAQKHLTEPSANAPPLRRLQPDGDLTVRTWPPSDANRQSTDSSRTTASSSDKTARSAAESAAVFERFMRTLPSSAVEDFTSTLQPIIVHGCATAGCHAPGNDTSFALLRLPQGKTASRRLTQRNLYNTAQLVDFKQPADSRLLKVASQPHGPLAAGVFGDRRSPKYQQLAAWVAQLTGEDVYEADAAADGAVASLDGNSSALAARGGRDRDAKGKLRAADSRRKKSPGTAAHHFPGSVQPAAFEPLDGASRPNQPADLRLAVGESPAQPKRAHAHGTVNKEPTRGADRTMKGGGKARTNNAWPPSAK